MLTFKVDFNALTSEGYIQLEGDFDKVRHANHIYLLDGNVYVAGVVHKNDTGFYAEPDWSTRKTISERINEWRDSIPELSTRPKLCEELLVDEKFKRKFFRMIDDIIQLGPRLYGYRSAGEVIGHVTANKKKALKEGFEGKLSNHSAYNEAYGVLSNVSFNAINRARGDIRMIKMSHPCHVVREMPRPEILERFSARQIYKQIYKREHDSDE